MKKDFMNVHLKKTLSPKLLWGLGVGYVISGMYFGWNLGLEKGGTYGMAIATLIITIMYVCFSFSYCELSCAIPKAGGGFDYANRALGKDIGFITGLAQVIEFVFAPPAIAIAIGAYLNLSFPQIPILQTAVIVYLLFTTLNVLGVKIAATFEFFITILAVAELLLFFGITIPHFSAVKRQWLGWHFCCYSFCDLVFSRYRRGCQCCRRNYKSSERYHERIWKRDADTGTIMCYGICCRNWRWWLGGNCIQSRWEFIRLAASVSNGKGGIERKFNVPINCWRWPLWTHSILSWINSCRRKGYYGVGKNKFCARIFRKNKYKIFNPYQCTNRKYDSWNCRFVY